MIILVGASSGIGNEILNGLSEIDEVLAIYHDNEPKHTNDKIIYEKVDITKSDQVENLLIKYSTKLNNIAFINLAAVVIDNLTPNITQDDIFKTYETNVFSNIYFVKYLSIKMIEQKWGRFIFFSSSKASKGDSGVSIYSSSKTSLIGYSRSLSKELGRYNITSNLISLGYFEGSMWNRLENKKKLELLKEVPTKKIGNALNILNVMNMLIKSDYVSGSNINIDGGI